jgi:CHAT domain-containing protein
MKEPALRLLFLVLIIIQLSIFNFAQTKPEQASQQLEHGKPIERELKGGEIHSYTFQLAKNQRCAINFIQRGINIKVDLYTPNGKHDLTVEHPYDAPRPLRIITDAKRESGIYRIEVRALSGQVIKGRDQIKEVLPLNEQLTQGRYEIKFNIIEISQESDTQEKIKTFAASLVTAKSEEERAELLSKKKELITVKLLYELYDHARRFMIERNYEHGVLISHLSIKLAEQIGDKKEISNALHNFGLLFLGRRDYTQALKYILESVALNESLLQSDLSMFPSDKLYMRAYRYDQFGLPDQFEFPSIRKKWIASQLQMVSWIYLQRNENLKALEFADRSTSLAKEVGSDLIVFQTRMTAGKAYRELNQLAEARKAFEESIAALESLRSSIVGDAFMTFFENLLLPYEPYIDLLMQQHKEQPSAGNDALALQINERGRARALLELLNEARADIRKGVAPELLAYERSLQQQFNERAEKLTRLSSGQHSAEQAALLKKEIDTLNADFRTIEARIRQQSPRYAALTQPQPLKLSEIQQEVLDNRTILLEYALGEKRSYLWAVTKDSIKSYELPQRAEIESIAKRVYALVSDGKLVIDDKAQAEYEREAARLSQMLLAPVATKLQDKRILIVADGALQYLPFGALPSPTAKNKRQPLNVENEIISLPSASTLGLMRRQTEGRSVASKTLAVFADPVFSSTDERLKVLGRNAETTSTKQSSQTKHNLIVERSAREIGVLREGVIQRLPFSRREAESILAIVPTGEKMRGLDFEANRANVLKADISQYRIVHFATHGLLNSEHPELSGVVLSLINEQGQPVDGFLRLNEIYNLKLSADLVVLSACQTALGKEVRGEGLIGLTRGFMYAGSPRVVASLWKVDDVATAELMKLFYEKMMKEKMRPAAALRAAKVEMSKQKRWSAPFYWAAFELQGEWR